MKYLPQNEGRKTAKQSAFYGQECYLISQSNGSLFRSDLCNPVYSSINIEDADDTVSSVPCRGPGIKSIGDKRLFLVVSLVLAEALCSLWLPCVSIRPLYLFFITAIQSHFVLPCMVNNCGNLIGAPQM